MKTKKYLLASACILSVISATTPVTAQMSPDSESVQTAAHKKARSAGQRVAADKIRRNHSFTDFGNDYVEFKNRLQKEYGLGYAVDVTYMPQYGAPSGKKTAFQTIIAPSLTWQAFDNEYGNLTLNAAFTAVRYSGRTAEEVGSRIGAVTGINDYTAQSNSYNELYFSYRFPGKMDWLTVALGQITLYNFDGTAYDSNQQVNFINYALSQNASATYPTASLGGYVQIAPNNEWSLALGAQDATNIDGNSISTAHLDQKHYTTFGSLSYTPTIKGLGSGQYSIMVYNQPYTFKQQQSTNGWSLNLSQDLGEKWTVFARVNGVSGSQAEIDQSWVLGAVINDPLERNPLDQIGFAGAYNKINREAVGQELSHDAEKVLEAYWAWGVSKWMTITPDIQFYFDPALNPKSDYATVVSLRGTIFF